MRLTLQPEVGFLHVAPGCFPEVPGIIDEAEDLDIGSGMGKGKKEFLRNLLTPKNMPFNSSILRFSHNPRVLEIVGDYLGPDTDLELAHVGVYRSIPTNRNWFSSQLFHLDGDASPQVKVFVFCTDVLANSGPLCVWFPLGNPKKWQQEQITILRNG